MCLLLANDLSLSRARARRRRLTRRDTLWDGGCAGLSLAPPPPPLSLSHEALLSLFLAPPTPYPSAGARFSVGGDEMRRAHPPA